MTERVTIRTGTSDDARGVLDLWREADAPRSMTDDDDALRTLVAHDPGALLLAEVAGEPVGTVIVGWDGWRGALYRLVVLPGWRRRGIARDLVAEAEGRLREAGARRVAAMVIGDHDPATAFWSAVGYASDPRLDRFVRML